MNWHSTVNEQTCRYCVTYISVTPVTPCNDSQSQSQNYFIEPYTMNMQISFFFNKVQHLTIIWEINTFMQSHSHTLIMKLGWEIREYSSVYNNIT